MFGFLDEMKYFSQRLICNRCTKLKFVHSHVSMEISVTLHFGEIAILVHMKFSKTLLVPIFENIYFFFQFCFQPLTI